MAEYPLTHTWVMYALRRVASAQIATHGCLHVAEIGDLDAFWGVLNTLPVPSAFMSSTRCLVVPRACEGYALFRRGWAPSWEACPGLAAEVVLREHVALDVLDAMWETLCMLLVGQSVDDDDVILGLRCVDKSSPVTPDVVHRCELWCTGTPEQIDAVLGRIDAAWPADAPALPKPLMAWERRDATSDLARNRAFCAVKGHTGRPPRAPRPPRRGGSRCEK